MESTMENVTETEIERVVQGNDTETGTGEESHVKETENTNPVEAVREEDPDKEDKDSTCSMVIDESTSLASNNVTPTIEKETNDDVPLENNDEKKTSPPPTPSPSLALETEEEGLIEPAIEDAVEHNIGFSEVSSDILKNDEDSVLVDKDTEVVQGETTTIPDIKLSEDIGSPHHHTNTLMEQEEAADGHNTEDKGSPLCHVNGVMEKEKAAEEHEILSSGDHNEIQASPDTKPVEENNDMIEEGEANNLILGDNGSGPDNHDQENTIEVELEPERPESATVLKVEDKLSEPLIETSMNEDKDPDMPATETLTDNDRNSDVLASGVAGDSDKGLPLSPATQTSSDRNEGITTLEAEPTEDMKLDVSDSKLVDEVIVDSTNNNDVNVEAAIDTERKDEKSDADNDIALVRCESGPSSGAVANIKSEMVVAKYDNNGVQKIDVAPPAINGTMNANRCFLLDDLSEGNESGTEEDQSAFMKELQHFFRERNMEFKPPKFYGEGLNCLKLWRAVIRLGGYDKVTGCKFWRQVGESFRPPKTCTTVSWTFRGFYEKALLEFERHKVSGGELSIPFASEPETVNIDNPASGSGRAKRDAATRAMQGWHLQRHNGNGEVTTDPANKDKSLVPHQKREKQIGTTPGGFKRKRPTTSSEHVAKNAIQVFRPISDVTVVDVGPPADWVKINVQRMQDCFEVYALVPGLIREEVRVQSDPAGRLVISGEPENPMNPWGATPFKKVVNLPTRIDPHHTSAVVTLNGQLFVRVPLEVETIGV